MLRHRKSLVKRNSRPGSLTANFRPSLFSSFVSALGILSIRSIPRFLLILPLVYLFAVAANTARILCWAAAFPVLHQTVPGGLLDAGHEIAGAVVYLPAALFVLETSAQEEFLKRLEETGREAHSGLSFSETPEPATLVLIGFVLWLFVRRGGPRARTNGTS